MKMITVEEQAVREVVMRGRRNMRCGDCRIIRP
jgi:hypothetical protein